MSKEYTPHTVIDGEEHIVQDTNGDLFAGQWQQKFLTEPEDMITIGHHKDPMRGPRRPSQYTIDSLCRHMLITGQSDYGTSSLVQNIQLQLIERGYGMTFIDPIGDESRDLLKFIPEDRLDDIVWIEPGLGEENIGFNIFETDSVPGDDIYNEEVNERANTFVNMLKQKSEYWDTQIGMITEAFVRELIRAEEAFTPIDLVKIINDEEEREFFLNNYGDNIDAETINIMNEQEDDAFEPILRRIREWVSDRDTRQFISHSECKLNISESIKDNKILILNTSNIEPSSTRNIIIWAFISQLYSAKKILTETDVDNSHFLFLNQCNMIEDALSPHIFGLISQGRNYNLGVISIVQRLNDLEVSFKKSVRQSEHTITLNVGNDPSETGSVAQLFDINANDISDLDRFECISHVMSENGYKSDQTVKINQFLRFKPQRENVDSIIQSSIDKYATKSHIDLTEYCIDRFVD